MLVILKIPVVYLCAVVWWAIRAEPRPLEGAGRAVAPSLGPSRPSATGGARRAHVLRRGPVPARRPVASAGPARLASARARVAP